MEEFHRRPIKVNFARKRVNPVLDTADCLIRDHGKISSLREETADKAILVFVGSAFKG